MHKLWAHWYERTRLAFLPLESWSSLQSGQTLKPTSHPVVSVLKVYISLKRLRSEVLKEALLETKWQNKVPGKKARVKQTGTFPQILKV